MSRRRRRLAAALGALVALLFLGRWTATLLADHWWAAQLSPAAASFILDWHILRFTLDLCGCLMASAWFIGHLLLVYRAVGTVQVRRNVANLEFREALTPRALLTVVVVAGVLLGMVVGVGASRWWRDVALAWQGVTYGINEPLAGRDLGVYVAQLPVWRAAHGFFLLLVLLALTGAAALYMLVGAIRWIERRPAINHHARAHLGWVLAALALALAWGYLLEPYELLARPPELLDQATWRATANVSPVLAGIALAAGGISALWAARPRHALVLSAWIVLAGSSIVTHWLLPSMLTGTGEPALDNASMEHLSRVAYGLEPLRITTLEAIGPPSPPVVPSLWSAAALARAIPGDSGHLVAVNPALMTPGGRRLPAWLIVRSSAGGHIVVTAVADQRVSPDGEPLYLRLGDTLARPGPTTLFDLPSDVLAPEAPPYRVVEGDAPGVRVGSWPRRLALAWALQAGDLLGNLPSGSRVDWRLSPEERLNRLAPFADWSAPVARVVDGELVWLLDGYVTSGTFPLTPRTSWRERRVGSVNAAFLATVNAESGAVRIYLQPRTDPTAAAWSRVSHGLVEPASAIPESVLGSAGYPPDWFRIQTQQLERAPWKLGVINPVTEQRSADQPPAQLGWAADTSGPVLTATLEAAGERRLSGILIGSRDAGRLRLALTRLDSATTLPVRDILQNRWARFPLYNALNDSIQEDGGKLERGPLKVELGPGGPIAYQGYFALRPSGGAILAWVSVAVPDRLGAGRTLREAWSNLLGTTVPAPPGPAQTGRLDEARRWMLHADSALHAGDWSEFGRAWNSLRNLLGVPLDSARF
ncbi:MAG TPA: UPF0182 family protein [Gemmatimonadales bacterium]|nr:UPF0182 family protein [Gemmatimonadales bacterium]